MMELNEGAYLARLQDADDRITAHVARLTAENAALHERVEKMQAVVDAAIAFDDAYRGIGDDPMGIAAQIALEGEIEAYRAAEASE